jgi:CheY-like chemotaxis protein
MKEHILFINENKEDLDVFLEALKRLPHEDGYKCTYAATAAQAMGMLKYLVPDYIFFDLHMQDMNGLQFLSLVRKEPKLQKAASYLYAESISADVYEILMTRGAAGWIEKTNSVNRLTTKLKIFIGDPYYSATV